MINIDNFKELLKILNFEEKRNVFSKHFTDTEAYLKVDFNKSELIYPEDKGFNEAIEFTTDFLKDYEIGEYTEDGNNGCSQTWDKK